MVEPILACGLMQSAGAHVVTGDDEEEYAAHPAKRELPTG